MKMLLAFLFGFVILLSGCQALALLEQVQGDKEELSSSSTQSSAQESRSSQAGVTISRPETSRESTASSGEGPPDSDSFTLNDNAELILGTTLADIQRRHGGPLRLYYDYTYGFFCYVGEADTQYQLKLAGFVDESPDSLYDNLIPDEYGAYHYDFENGVYTPSDFMVITCHVWDDALAELFDGKNNVTAAMLADFFGEDKRHTKEEEGMTISVAGPYPAGNHYWEFGLDGDAVVSAEAAWGFPDHIVLMYCGGIEPGTDKIWLAEPGPDGMMDGGGGSAYTMTFDLRWQLELAPPIDGELYHIWLTYDNKVTDLFLVRENIPEDWINGILQDTPEVVERMQAGMAMLATFDPVVIGGEVCYMVALGTNHPDQFVREIHYAVEPYSNTIYRLDILTNTWEVVS